MLITNKKHVVTKSKKKMIFSINKKKIIIKNTNVFNA